MRRDIKSELYQSLPGNVLGCVKRSFDIIGSKRKAVAIIELPERLDDYELEIAEAIKRVHRNVSSVLSKESERLGEFRTRNLRLVAGDPDTEVMHRESGCYFKLDPRKVYFSPRESAERDRIAAKVVREELVLVMFSGVGPFPIRIAKRERSVKVTAVEVNPHAHNYCVENIHLNKVGSQVDPKLGDVRIVCPNLGKTFDRILMPLPKGAYKFLNVAIPLLRDEGVIHFYHWASKEDLFSKAEKFVAEAAENFGKGSMIIERRKVSQYSPNVWKIRVDARIISS
jgi:tRNA (guanine37-N1)-methyltransferase